MTVSHSSSLPLHHGPLLPNLSASSLLPPSSTRCHKTHTGPLAPSTSPLINSPPDIKYPPADTDDPKAECPCQTSTLSHRLLNPSALLTLYLLNVSARMRLQNTNQITPLFCFRPFRMSGLAFSASEPVPSCLQPCTQSCWPSTGGHTRLLPAEGDGPFQYLLECSSCGSSYSWPLPSFKPPPM